MSKDDRFTLSRVTFTVSVWMPDANNTTASMWSRDQYPDCDAVMRDNGDLVITGRTRRLTVRAIAIASVVETRPEPSAA